jgi:hypothetical protein
VFEVEFVVVFEVFELFVFWPKAKTLHVSANTMERAIVSFFTSASLLVIPGCRLVKGDELAQTSLTMGSRFGGIARTS